MQHKVYLIKVSLAARTSSEWTNWSEERKGSVDTRMGPKSGTDLKGKSKLLRTLQVVCAV